MIYLGFVGLIAVASISLVPEATELLADLALSVFWSVLFLGYVLFSKRVNVTFRHRIRRADLPRVMSRDKIETIKFVRYLAKQAT